jgi:hypothetical protein
MKKETVLCFDLDGVICKTFNNNYLKSIPIKKNINFINYLFKKKFIIKIFTARGMGSSNENIRNAKRKFYNFTIKQLKLWKLNYHKLIFGKPSYDIMVDDKSLFFKKNWNLFLLKKINLDGKY